MRTLLGVVLLASCLGWCGAICVMDNKYGWSIECGIRDSYLFRVKDYGGIKANFDFGIEFGDEKGFKSSIRNTAGGHYRRNDNTARISQDETEDSTALNPDDPSTSGTVHGRQDPAAESRRDTDANQRPPRRWARPGPAFRLQPPPPPANRRQSFARPFRHQNAPQNRPRPQNRPGRHTRRGPQNRQHWRRVPVQGPLIVPVQGTRMFAVPGNLGNPAHSQALPRPGNGQVQNQPKQFFVSPHQVPPFFFTQAPPVLTPPPSPSSTHPVAPTVGPVLGEVLKVNADTPADTDHVPSFAAKMFVVREAPEEFHPPGYSPLRVFPKVSEHVEVPRTKFFCEEQKYLPGIYADSQLGCKVFHLCLPAAMGNTLTSFLCPNMTLFDQSILQCNWWYYVSCENSNRHYDANLPMALSYRKINAAQLPLSGVSNFDSVSLLSHNAEELKNPHPIETEVSSNIAFKRRGRADDSVPKVDVGQGDGIPRQPRMLNDDGVEKEKEQKVSKETKEEEENGSDKDDKPTTQKIKGEGNFEHREDKIITKTKVGEDPNQPMEDKVIKINDEDFEQQNEDKVIKVKDEEDFEHQKEDKVTNVKDEDLDQQQEDKVIKVKDGEDFEQQKGDKVIKAKDGEDLEQQKEDKVMKVKNGEDLEEEKEDKVIKAKDEDSEQQKEDKSIKVEGGDVTQEEKIGSSIMVDDELDQKEDRAVKETPNGDDTERAGVQQKTVSKRSTAWIRRRRNIDLHTRVRIPPLLSRLYNSESYVA